MVRRSAFVIALAVTATVARGQQPGSSKPTKPRGPILNHTSEPIVIRDGSVKIDIYARENTPPVIVNPDTVVTNGDSGNQATLLVPTGVGAVKIGRRVVGRLQFGSALAHRPLAILRYVYQVERFDGTRFVPYSQLIFESVKFTWRISPKGQSPLKLTGCSAPIPLSGAWANHFQSTCEYGYSNLKLRIGSVTVESVTGAPIKINLATGCSEFRIEPLTHRIHAMTFDHPSCEGLRLNPTMKFPTVQVKGVSTINAIDVSLVKARNVLQE